MKKKLQKETYVSNKIWIKKSSTNVTIFDKDGDKFSLTEPINEVYEVKIIKEYITSLSKYNKNSLQDDIVENL